MPDKPWIVLLRTPRSPDPYRNIFENAGFRVHVVPVLRFAFVHDKQLREYLDAPAEFDGLVATSPRAVEALRRLDGAVDGWLHKWFFTAGPETARRAGELGFSPRGQEAGSADDLADIIIDQHIERPLLFVSGNRRRDTLPARLKSAEVPFKELVVYESYLRRQLDWPFEPADLPEWVVFFSPSGIEAARHDDRIPWARLRKAAIGPTTAGALRERAWTVDAVAERPEPEALRRAVVGAG